MTKVTEENTREITEFMEYLKRGLDMKENTSELLISFFTFSGS
jgi:hypothetical protein